MTDVLDHNTVPPPNTVAPVNPDPLADKLMKIVDANGRPKYDSVEKALEALNHSQTHIQQLEAEAQARKTELEQIRSRAAQADALEAVIERLQPNTPPVKIETPTNTGLSEEATIAQLEKVLEKRELAKKAEENFKAVNNQLLAKFGNDPVKAKEAVATKAAELGITVADLAALSSKSPAAVLAYFGETPRTVQPVTPSLNTPITPPSNDEGLKPPTKSLLLGSTSREQREYMKKIKEEVYKKHGITE